MMKQGWLEEQKEEGDKTLERHPPRTSLGKTTRRKRIREDWG
jgi:hypothetical protein